MKKLLGVAIISVAIFAYLHQSPGAGKKVAPQQTIAPRPASTSIVVAPITPYDARWKTGPNDARWKTGPNAQTSFEPFAPSEHASWNRNPGYTVIAGPRVRR